MYTIVDEGEGVNDIQSIIFQEDLDIFTAGLSGIDCVLSGLAVTGGADMTPAVAKGSVLSNRIMYAVAAADVTISAAHASHPRIDLIVVNSSGALAVRAGTAGLFPKPPVRTANDVVIAMVYVPAGATTIPTTYITDKRVTPKFPICIYKMTTAETTNTTAAAIDIIDKTNSGLTIPNGLFLTGRKLRIRAGGNVLHNALSPTINVAVLYGGTTLFSDISTTSTNDPDRPVWYVNLDLTAVSNTSQVLHGMMIPPDRGGLTAPTTGYGEAFSPVLPFGFLNGTSAVDSDAADSKLRVQFTFSSSDVAHEIVTETVTVELM